MFKTQIIAILIFHPGHIKKSIFYLIHNIETLIRASTSFKRFPKSFLYLLKKVAQKMLKKVKSCSKETFDKFCPQFKPKNCSFAISWNCRFRWSAVYKDLNILLHLRHSNQSSVNHWPSSSAAPGEKLAPFSKEINKLSTKTLWNMKARPI